MAMYLETLEPVIATALNILKNRPLADLYVRRDRMGDFRIRVQLESRDADYGARRAYWSSHSRATPDRIATLTVAISPPVHSMPPLE